MHPWSLEISLAVGLVFWMVFAWSALLRRIVPREAMATAVHRRAMVSFVENGLHDTEQSSGVLILVSRLEHRVEILADSGIHARIGVEGWSSHVQTIISAIKDGHPAEGLQSAIHRIGEELARHFPPRPDDTNELENHVIVTAR
ncbi:MAG: hypothetical protein HC923_12505 [Myxococcales bacterium]|nr:hypothetical protein [Myxococcales bacterium]